MGDCNFDDVNETMPRFIEIFYKNYKAGGVNLNWSSHTNSYLNGEAHVMQVKYENLLKDGINELERIVKWLGYQYSSDLRNVVDKYSFTMMSNKIKGVENRGSFLRKGIAGDWKNYFNRTASELFNQYHGGMLKELGYD